MADPGRDRGEHHLEPVDLEDDARLEAGLATPQREEAMGLAGGGQMSPLATELRDDAGYELVRTWIRGL